MSTRAYTLVEALISTCLLAALVGAGMWVWTYSGRSTGRLTGQLALAQGSRKAIVRFLREIQEGMEVVSPHPGSTLPYCVMRDRVALVRWFYQVPHGPGTGPPYDLCRYLDDPSLPVAGRTEVLLSGIRRLTFTSRTEGAVQVNLLLSEEGQDRAMLTTVRLRNLASAEELW